MITKVRDKWNNIPSLNLGVSFLQVFIWLTAILIALVFEKGIETIYNLFDFNDYKDYHINIWPSVNNIGWILIMYFLLFVNFIIFALRYLFWTPWPIYNNIFNLRKIEEDNSKKIDTNPNEICVKGIFSNINFNKLIWGLTNSNGSEVFWSSFVFLVEFYIIYMGVMSFGDIGVTIAFVFALPLVDFAIPLLSSLSLIKKKHFKKEVLFKSFKSKSVKHYFKSRKWLLPWVFLRPFLYDFFIPMIIFLVTIVYVLYTKNGKLSFTGFNVRDFINDYPLQLMLSLTISLLITNILVIRFLRKNYYDVGQVLFNLTDIQRQIQSPYRPMAYVSGKSDFMESELYIDERVYPPTPETEILVDYAIKELENFKVKPPTVLDIGTGSGNIAISIARKIKNIDIWAIDKSNLALDLAKENIEKYGIETIRLRESDLLKTIKSNELNNPDLIVANLPYGSDEYLLESNPKESIKFMPRISVFPTKGIIGDYVKLVEEILDREWSTTLLIEIGPVKDDIITKEFSEEIRNKIEYKKLTKKIKITEETDDETNTKYKKVNVIEDGKKDDEGKIYTVLKIKFNHEK